MKNRTLTLISTLSWICQFASPAFAEIATTVFRFTNPPSPAIFVNATGEGCCTFTAELDGGFRLHHDPDQVWVDGVDVLITSVITWRHGIPLSPDDPLSRNGKEFLENKLISLVMPGILSNIPGQLHDDSSYQFGPATTPDLSYNWFYTIFRESGVTRLRGESKFLGDDGADFYIDALLVQIVPEPATCVAFASVFVLQTCVRRRG